MIPSVNESGAAENTAAQQYDNASDFVYYFIGCLMTLIMLFGFSANFVILYTFSINKKIRTMDNTLVIGLAISDIGQSVLGLPLVVIASFSKKWIFGHIVCQYYAFVTTCLGIAQIATLTVIAMERYFVIVRLDRRMTSTTCRSVFMILFAFLYGAVWALGPLLGWSQYKQEDIGIACCVTWEVKDRLSLSYTFSICTFGWFIPLIFIAFGYISIACSIFQERNKRSNLRSQQTLNKSNRERKVAFTVLIMIGAFIVSWTPYSVVSLWSAIRDVHSIPTWVVVAPAVFAKCSIIWNPIIYVARHVHFRKAVYESLSFLQVFKRNNTLITSFKTEFNSRSLKQTYAKTSKQRYGTPQRLLQKPLLQASETLSPSNIKGRSISLSSNDIISPFLLRRGRLCKQPTLYSHIESSQETSSDCEEKYNDNKICKHTKETLEVNGQNLNDNDSLLDDVFEDMSVSQQLSKCVQTDICLTDAILPFAVKKHKYSQTHPIGVSEKLLHYTLETDGGTKSLTKGSATKPGYDTELTSPLEKRQHEQSLKSKLHESVTCHRSSLPESRKLKGTNLETLKQARNLLKQRLEMIYTAQCTSMIYGNVLPIYNNSTRSQLYYRQQADAARSKFEYRNENVPFMWKSDTWQRRGITGAEPKPSYHWSIRPQCQTQNFDRLEFSSYSKSNNSRRQKGKLVSFDDTVKQSPDFRPFVRRQTSV